MKKQILAASLLALAATAAVAPSFADPGTVTGDSVVLTANVAKYAALHVTANNQTINYAWDGTHLSSTDAFAITANLKTNNPGQTKIDLSLATANQDGPFQVKLVNTTDATKSLTYQLTLIGAPTGSWTSGSVGSNPTSVTVNGAGEGTVQHGATLVKANGASVTSIPDTQAAGVYTAPLTYTVTML